MRLPYAIAIDPVETGFPGAGMTRETRNNESRQAKPVTGGSLMEETPPDSKPGFA
jgi:hypothetical protein